MRKKILCLVLLMGFMAGNAWGLPFVETYVNNTPYAGGTGEYMETGDWVTLGFDFEYDISNVLAYHFVDSNFGAELNLIADEELLHAHSAWRSGWVDFKFWSGDEIDEYTTLSIYSGYNDTEQYFLKEYEIDDLDNLGGGYWGYKAFIVDLDSWSNDAWGDVTVEATGGNFLLTSVSVSLEPVPEPGTIFLLGAGLVGVVLVRRKAGRLSMTN